MKVEVVILSVMMRESLTEEMSFEQRTEGVEEAEHVGV